MRKPKDTKALEMKRRKQASERKLKREEKAGNEAGVWEGENVAGLEGTVGRKTEVP